MLTESNKLFVVRKYIYARNAKEAIKLDKTSDVDDVFVDSDWQKAQIDNGKSIGFNSKN